MGILDDVRRIQTGGHNQTVVDANGVPVTVIPGEFTGGEIEVYRGDLARLLYGPRRPGIAASTCWPASCARSAASTYRRVPPVHRAAAPARQGREEGQRRPLPRAADQAAAAHAQLDVQVEFLLRTMMKMTDDFATDIEDYR